jgi:hypothetical protein
MKLKVWLLFLCLGLMGSKSNSVALEMEDRRPDQGPLQLSILAYNIFMRPTLLFKDKQAKRAEHLVK